MTMSLAERVPSRTVASSRLALATALQPPLDIGPEPAASAARAFLREGPGAHPAVDGAAVAARDSFDIVGAQYLIYSSDPLR